MNKYAKIIVSVVGVMAGIVLAEAYIIKNQ